MFRSTSVLVSGLANAFGECMVRWESVRWALISECGIGRMFLPSPDRSEKIPSVVSVALSLVAPSPSCVAL